MNEEELRAAGFSDDEIREYLARQGGVQAPAAPAAPERGIRERIFGDPVSDRSLSDLVTGRGAPAPVPAPAPPAAPAMRVDPAEVARLRAAGFSDAEIQAAGVIERADFSGTIGGASLGYPKMTSNESMAGLLRSAEQGLTFGFGDEINARVRSLLPGQTYESAVEDERAKLERFRTQQPGAAAIAELGGGVAPALASGGLAILGSGAKTLMGRTAASALGGAAAGGLYGLGTGEGGLGERLPGAAFGAATGGALGAAIPPAARVAGAAADAVRTLRMPATERGARLVQQALEADKTTPDAIRRQAHAARAVSGPKPETIADYAGPNTRSLLAAGANRAGDGRRVAAEALGRRGEEQLTRIVRDVEGRLGPKQDVTELAEQIIQRRAAAAQPAYDAAFAKGVVSDPDVIESVRHIQQNIPGAHSKALRLAALERIPEDHLITADGLPTVRYLHFLKMGVDDAIDIGSRSADDLTGMGRTMRGSVVKVQNEFLERLDRAVPEYGTARSQFAGESRLREMLEEGRQFLRARPEEAEKLVAGLSDAEREMYRVGAVSALREMMEGAPDKADLVKRLFGNTVKRQRLAILFDDPREFQALESAMAREAGMRGVEDAVFTGSRTTPLLEEMRRVDGTLAEDIVRTGGVRGPLIGRLLQTIDRTRKGQVGRGLDEATKLLLQGADGPQYLLHALNQLQYGPSKGRAVQALGRAAVAPVSGNRPPRNPPPSGPGSGGTPAPRGPVPPAAPAGGVSRPGTRSVGQGGTVQRLGPDLDDRIAAEVDERMEQAAMRGQREVARRAPDMPPVDAERPMVPIKQGRKQRWEGGNPKYAATPTEKLQARFREVWMRVNRENNERNKGTTMWAREDPNSLNVTTGIQGVRSGVARTGRARSATAAINRDVKMLDEIEQELLGRGVPEEEVRAMIPSEAAKPAQWSPRKPPKDRPSQ